MIVRSLLRYFAMSFSLIILGLLLFFFAYLPFRDYMTVREVKIVISYLEDYYKQNQKYPTREIFYLKNSEKFKYTFYPNSPNYFSITYPVSKTRFFATGTPIHNEFIGGVSNYSINSCSTGGSCEKNFLTGSYQ